jgi:hypothetical protein
MKSQVKRSVVIDGHKLLSRRGNPYRRYGGWGGGYWPWGLGAGLAVAAATWPYYGGYGYDDCVQWRPDWGWVNVCESPYGGYYPY